MNKRVRCAIASVALLLATVQPAQAAEVWHTSKIKSIYPMSDGSFVLTFETESPRCTNGEPRKYYYALPGANSLTAEGAKKLYAAAMFAASPNKDFSIAFDDATNACAINRGFVVM